MKRIILIAMLFLLAPQSAHSATTWYMPEGSTQGFDLWIIVANLNDSSAEITYTFYIDTGTVTQTATISANMRKTLHVNSIEGLANKTAITTKVECTNGLNIYAERAMYWPNDGSPWVGGHSSRAVSGLEGSYTEISQPSSFPITISLPGSYKLVSDISCSSTTAEAAIVITASHVTFDFNGHTVSGFAYAVSSSDGLHVISLDGITPVSDIIIMNGKIHNFGYDAYWIDNATNVTIRSMDIINNGKFGIAMSSTCDTGVIENCIIYGNGDRQDGDESGGIYVSKGYSIKNNVINSNSGYGIYIAGKNNFIKDNIISSTRSGGISEAGIYTGASAMYNRIESNHIVGNDTNDVDDDGSANSYVYNTVKTDIADADADDKTMNDDGVNEKL